LRFAIELRLLAETSCNHDAHSSACDTLFAASAQTAGKRTNSRQARKQLASAQTAGKRSGTLQVTPSAYRIATHPQPPLRFRFGYCGCAAIHAYGSFGTFGTFAKLGQ
jgi:hypothetical protein